ncbi:MAG TPA: serine hydrolase [Patescibacteria group bacterium]
MFGIRRKKDKDEETLDEEEKGKEEDLKPKKKRKPRKKKEESKPWGKKERIAVFGVLSFTVLSSLFLTLSGKKLDLASFNISLPSLPSFNLANDRPVVLGKSDSKFLTKDEMKKALNDKIAHLPGTYGIEIIELDSGKNYGINQNEKFEGASFFKVPLMIAVYKEAEKGKIDLSATHILRNYEKVGGAGVLVGLPDGTSISYKDLVSYMGHDSDNTAFNILGNQIGWDSIDEITKLAGMQNTSFKDSVTTPYDMGLLFSKLEKGDLVSNISKKEILDTLIDTDYENLIPKGVDSGIVVAHKYASDTGVTHDGGIIFSRNPYVLVIMTKGEEEEEVDSIIPDLSRIVFNAEQ